MAIRSIVCLTMQGAFPWRYDHWERGHTRPVDSAVIREELVRIHVNGVEFATFMCTPVDLDKLALGFLCSEGIIQSLEDVRLLVECPSRTCVEVWLWDANVELPTGAILTSGCGGGITFDDLSQRVTAVKSQRRVTAEQITAGVSQLMSTAVLYKLTRGVHASALSDGDRLVVMAEDVGRHNTIDKLWGQCLVQGIDPAHHILFATGRISSEMLNKAAKMRVPVVASRTSPTSLSVRLAQEWDILLAGYVRSNSFNIYAGQWRLLSPEPSVDDGLPGVSGAIAS